MVKKSILFYAGNFNKNEITTSFIDLVNSLDTDRYNISIVVQMNIIEESEARVEGFRKINKNIKIITRTGKIVMTKEEKKIYNFFEQHQQHASKEEEYCYQQIYTKEYSRIFENLYFDAVIHYEGYNLFWQRLFAYAPKFMIKLKSIFLHYDMKKIWKEKYASLQFNFMIYNEFDYLISTSEKLRELNSHKLATDFNINKNKFICLNKIHNPKNILEKSRASLSPQNLFLDTKVFINIARIVPENGQEKILLAFKRISLMDSSTRLVYLGVGSFENKLRFLIKDLDLNGKVFLLGQRYNPYAYLEKANCLIDASESLEQSMILKEAYLMKKPIITTDTDIHKRILIGEGAVFVENTENGFYEGMSKFLDETSIEQQRFNYSNYNNTILQTFEQIFFSE